MTSFQPGTAPLLAVLLLALLVGAAIPVLYQFYHLLRKARTVLDATGPRLETVLDHAAQTTERLNGIGTLLEVQVQALTPLFETASRSGRWLGTAMNVGGAVGPAVIAGARALFSGTETRPGTNAPPSHRRRTDDRMETQTAPETQPGETS